VRALVAAVVVLALLPGTASAASPTSHARMKAVVQAWSTALNANDNAAIARLFALPAIIAQGPYVYKLRTRAQVAEWYSGLPCSGKIVAVALRGRFATAVFRLGNRGKTKCDAPGGLAAAKFEIVNGKIASWTQVAAPAKNAPPQGPVA
jgi:hypothetical protein